ncbi:MAG: Holliday junction branch migration protein RuvA [Opitutales bacterium]
MLLYTNVGVIAVLQGEVLEASPLGVVIDVGGVGYEVHVPVSTAERVPPVGGRVRLFIHDVYREDGQDLYGFIRREERDFFRMIVEKVSGIGPRTAIALLSKLSLTMLSSAIAAGDVNTLARTPGIGKKTAERLVVELRDKMQAFSGFAVHGAVSVPGGVSYAGAASPVCDAVNALVILGYRPDAADKAVQKALAKLGPEASTDALLRAALAAG